MPHDTAMDSAVTVIGLRGDTSFGDIVAYFTGRGGDVILLDPEMVCGKSHIESAVMHARRAFDESRNRSKTVLTETILYAAGERQIGKALKKMGPKPGKTEFVACVFGLGGEICAENIGMRRDDSLCDASDAKASNLGIPLEFGIPPGDLALEMVASVDLLKQ